MESRNKNKNITDSLLTEDIKAAKTAIKKIRRTGKAEDIPGIIEAYKLQEKEAIRKEIHTLLCDVQLKGASDFIIEGIKDPGNQIILDRLLSICWESKQDFTPYLEIFISAFLNADYAASIEAFTIIEKIFTDYNIPEDKLNTTIRLIKTSYPDLPQNKGDLALVLLDTLDNLPDSDNS